MKKLLKITKNLIISSLLVLLFIPIFVLADGASPGFASYDAFVSDSEGASLYLLDDSKLIKTNIVLKYNDEIYVEDEVKVSKDTFYAKIDGEKYKDQLDSSYKGYENWYYYINTDRIAIRGKEFTYSDLVKLEKKSSWVGTFYTQKIITLDDSVSVLKGPSVKYDTVKKFEKNTSLTIKGELSNFYYVEGKDLKGWILKDSIIADVEEYSLWAQNDIETYDNPLNLNGQKTDVVIPKDTKFNSFLYYYKHYLDYDYSDDSDSENIKNMYRVKYNDEYYWVLTNDFAIEDGDKILVTEDFNYYDSINGKLVGQIPLYTELTEEYYIRVPKGDDYVYWYYISYKKNNYWINSSEGDYTTEIDEDWKEYYCEKFEYDINLYDNTFENNIIGTIPANTKVCTIYYPPDDSEKWWYINNKNYKGWINAHDGDSDSEDDEEDISYNPEPNTDPLVNPNPVNEEPEVVQIENKLSNKELIIIGALSAVILALVIYVIILLVNKKKKEKNETVEVVQEQPKEEIIETTEPVQEQPIEENKDAQN